MFVDPIGFTKEKKGKSNFGFIDKSSLPTDNSPTHVNLPSLDTTTDWAITSSYSSYAKNHCGATAATNIALYLANSSPSLLINNKDETFKAVHGVVGNGPLMTIANGLKKYAKNQEVTLKYSGASGKSGVTKAIDDEKPVGMLLSNGLLSWHWVVVVGYVKYSNDDIYYRIVNGWDDTSEKYYKPGKGSRVMATTKYWIK
jgi:hypothetical protein